MTRAAPFYWEGSRLSVKVAGRAGRSPEGKYTGSQGWAHTGPRCVSHSLAQPAGQARVVSRRTGGGPGSPRGKARLSQASQGWAIHQPAWEGQEAGSGEEGRGKNQDGASRGGVPSSRAELRRLPAAPGRHTGSRYRAGLEGHPWAAPLLAGGGGKEYALTSERCKRQSLPSPAV